MLFHSIKQGKYTLLHSLVCLYKKFIFIQIQSAKIHWFLRLLETKSSFRTNKSLNTRNTRYFLKRAYLEFRGIVEKVVVYLFLYISLFYFIICSLQQCRQLRDVNYRFVAHVVQSNIIKNHLNIFQLSCILLYLSICVILPKIKFKIFRVN